MECTITRKRPHDASDDDGPRKQAMSDATVPPSPAATTCVAHSSTTTASPVDVAAGPPKAAVYFVGRKARRERKKRKRQPRTQPRVSAPEAAEAPPPTRPPSTPAVRPRPSPLPVPAEDDFQEVVSKAARRRARALVAAAIATDPAAVATVLYRPSSPGGSFAGSPRLALAAALSARPGVTAVRVNHRRNIVAADASSSVYLAELLTITELNGIPVTAREPTDRRSSLGCVYGVDGDITIEELLDEMDSAAPVLSATREGRAVKLRFGTSVPPEFVKLRGLRLRVRHVRPRPLQCRQCGRLDHVAEACQRAGECIRCGRRHQASEQCKPRCVNCSGSHAADNPTCPRWQEERRVATLLASSPTPLSRRAVKAAVREETREVRSYAAALKASPSERHRDDHGSRRPVPAPRRRITIAASPAATASPAAPPTAPSADPRDALIEHLLVTLRSVAEELPADNPRRGVILALTSALPSAVPSE